jgi:sugar lactone lactonase YvrE
MSPLPDGAGFWVAESNSGQILKVGLDGEIVRVVDLSGLDPIPTGIVAAPGGGAYVAYFTRAPYVEGAAKVVLVGDDGSVSDAWTGLSLPTAVEIGPDGELYALEMATGFAEDGRALGPGTGRVVRQRGPSEAEPVVTGLALPAAMAFGPDGALFVSGPTVGADEGEGTILRLDLGADGGAPIAVPETSAQSSPSACPPA